MSQDKLDITTTSLETFSNLDQNDAKVISATPVALPGTAGGPVDRAKVSEELAKEEDGVGKGSVEGVVSKDLLDTSQHATIYNAHRKSRIQVLQH